MFRYRLSAGLPRARGVLLGVIALSLGCQEGGLTKFNNDPDATIRTPTRSFVYGKGVPFFASGSVDDDDHATEDLVARWYVDGAKICETDVLEDGETECILTAENDDATIRLEVEDPLGAVGFQDLVIDGFTNRSPIVAIERPSSGGHYYEDQKVQFGGIISDPDHTDYEEGDPKYQSLDDLVLTIESDLDGVLVQSDSEDAELAVSIVAGESYSTFNRSLFLSKGDHKITAFVTDSFDATSATETIEVTVGGPNNDPTCEITAPDPELAVAVDSAVDFVGTVLDMDLSPEDYASNIKVTWVSSLDGVLEPTEYDASGQTMVSVLSLRKGNHLITLQAEDDVGGRCTDSINLEVGDPPTLSVLEPEEGSIHGYGEPLIFRAIVSDGEDSPTEIDLKWETTDDGRFSDQGADSAGVAEFAADFLRSGPKTLTVTATDSGGLFTKQLVSFTINELPSAPTIQLTNEADSACVGADIYTSDTLEVCFIEHSIDPDGDPVEYTYQWFKDGLFVEELSDPTVPPMETANGETWRVQVTPRDSLSEGPFAQSTITIRNTPPVLEDVSLTPEGARTADDITCNVGALTDPDGDTATYTYLWTVNGVSMSTTDAVLAASSHKKGDEVVCTVTPSDDSDSGAPTASPILTIANTAPSVAEAIIIEDYISTGDTLNCTHDGFTDVDGPDEPDETFYRWTVDGSHVADGPTLYGGFSGGDLIACQAIPFDGEDEGEVVQVTAEVSNSSPTIDSVTISPSGPTAVDSLTCSWDGFTDADEGDEDLSTAVWAVDGLEVGTGTTLAGVFSGGQLVSCTVSAYDGTSYGTTLITSVMVLNTPPSADSAVITPDPATVVDDLTCSAVGYTDPDIYDVDESIFSWTVNGVPAGTEATLTEGFVGGDDVQCTLTPFDGTTYATPLVVSQVITNTPATVGWVTLSPETAKADDPLTCTWAEPTDPDGHTLEVTAQWTINGEFAGNGDSLTTGYGAEDEVMCSVSVHDGFETGPVTSASVIIENTLPSIDGVAIVPNPAKATDPLTCTWSGYFDIDGDPDMSIATWAINGLFVGVGPTLPAGYVGADVVSCTVIPSDGRDSAGALIDTIVVSNSAPTVDVTTIYPLDAMVGDELTCAYTGYNDVDGDFDASTLTWFINEVEAGTGETLLGGFAGGDTIRCQVNPYDGIDWGDPVSGSQTISNTAPSVDSVQIDPEDPQTGELVTCSWSGYSDPDGHPDESTVEWFVNGISTEVGPTISSDFTAGDDLKCEVTPFDGFESGTPVSHSVVVSNAPPQVASVFILPLEPKTENPLSCNWMGYADPEGDPDMSTVTWTINGEPAGTGTILSSGYVHGDIVACEVTPSDGMDEGIPMSADTPVDNTLPVISGLSIEPAPAYRTQELSCLWESFVDPDGEPDMTTVEWEVNDEPMGTGYTLPVGIVDEGDTVRCTATAHDGTEEGNTMGVLVTVSESVPSIDSVEIEPFPAYKDSSLTCGWDGYYDADGDPDASFVVWTVNGVVASTDYDISDAYQSGDVVVCEVSPYDGDHIGTPISATVTIANAPPIVHSVTLLPEPAYDGSPLNCMPGFTSDVDGTTEFSYRYKWYVNGSEVPGEITDNLPPGFFSKDQTVKCAASASDGTDFGGYQESLEKYVLNTAPVINSVSIGPSSARTNDTISASVDTTDIDGDSLTLYYDWYVSGELVSTFPTLDGATYFDKDETIYLEVSASDGEDESAPFGSNTIIINNTPSTGPTVTVTPEDPVTGAEGIICTMAGEGDDEDGDDLTYTYSWHRDGELWEGAMSTTLETDDTIEAENLKSYEVWTCLITPNDGDEDGTPGTASAEVQTIFSGWGAVDISLGDVDLQIYGEDNKDYSGRGVAWAGDVDGDDRTDILVAAPDNDDAFSSAGKVYLLPAANYDGYSAIPLNDVEIAWTGSGAGHNLGGYVQSKAMSTAGDIDGDELDDFIIGEPLYINPSTGGTDGRAYLILSASISATGPVTIPSITTADYIIDGRAYGQLGHAAAMVGDVDGRGQGDILLGSPSANGGRGEAYLLYGEDFGTDSTLDMDVDAAVTFTGEAPGDDAGLRFTSVGDVDADGAVDILIAAPSNDVGGETKSGRSYLFTSASIVSTEHNLSADAEWLFNGEDSNDLSGHAMARLGDLDKDGYGDFMISGKGQDTFGSNSGLVYVINGGALPIFRTFNLEDAWFKIGGEAAGDRAGHDLAYAGDVDADGRGDLLISAYANDAGGSSSGRTYLVLGASIPSDGGSMTLSDTDFSFTGESLADSSGYSIAGNGDFDADGLSDFLIGAYLRDSTASDAGTTYMVISPSVYH